MNLFDRLQFQELLKDANIRTYVADDAAGGRSLLVHWMPVGTGSEIHSLLQLLDSLPSAGRSLILEAGMRDGRMYLITANPFPGNPSRFPGLQEWLSTVTDEKVGQVSASSNPTEQQRSDADLEVTKTMIFGPVEPVAAPIPSPGDLANADLEITKTMIRDDVLPVTGPIASIPSPPAAVPPQPERAEGEFTRLFKMEPAAPSATPAAVVAPKTVSPPTLAPKTQEPGEFTRIFVTGSSPEEPKPSTPQETQPSEFTRLFQTPTAPATAPPKLSQPQDTQPGEFTRLFQNPTAPAAAPPEPSQPQQTQPGEFTRIFAGPSAPPTAPPKGAPPQTAQPGEFTRFFQNPTGQNPTGQTPTTPSAALPPPKPAQQQAPQPGEFTRLFQNPLATPGPAATAENYFSKPVPNAPAEKVGGEFTRLFGRPGTSSDAAKSESITKEATGVFGKPVSPIAPAAPQGPSEYTRMFSVPVVAAQAEAPVSAPVQAQPPAIQKSKSALPLVLTLAVLAVLALVLVFVFIRK